MLSFHTADSMQHIWDQNLSTFTTSYTGITICVSANMPILTFINSRNTVT